MPMIISTHSFRGGTGKSNTTANLASLVARSGKRVGVIDTDIQSPGIHVIFRMEDLREGRSLNDYLWGRCRIEEAAYDVTDRIIPETAAPGARLFLIPASIKTGEIAQILQEGYDVGVLNDGLSDLVRSLELDFLFIDTHPGVNEETLLSIAISDVLMLIVRPDRQDFQGTAVAVELARKLEVPKMMLLVNKIPPGTDTQALGAQVEQLFKAEVVALLPLNSEIARLASSGLFCLTSPEHPFAIELAKVADRLVAAGRSRLADTVG